MASSLPAEVLREIFPRCLHSENSFRKSDGPLPLTHVCRAWRCTALDTAKLWSTITVPHWTEAPHHVGELVNLWLDRAGNALLDIDIRFLKWEYRYDLADQEKESIFTHFENILRMLAPHRARVCSFQAAIPQKLIADAGVHEMPNIVFLGITACELDGLDASQITDKLYIGPARGAFKLLALGFCNVERSSLMAQTQLTVLSIQFCIVDVPALELLTELPALEYVNLGPTRKKAFTISGRIELRNLKTLQLSSSDKYVLGKIRTPYLQTLGMKTWDPSDSWDSGDFRDFRVRVWDALYGFLSLSRPPLQHMTLSDYGAYIEHSPLDCIAICPSLVRLEIYSSKLSDGFFSGLTRSDATQVASPLPNLRTFHMGHCTGFSGRALVQFLSSRASDGPTDLCRLQNVTIKGCNQLKRDRSKIESCGIENLVFKD